VARCIKSLAIREAMTTLDDLLAYQDAWEQGLLHVRVRLMMRVGSEQSTDEAIGLVRGLGARSGFGDDWLRIWGLKLVLDGGVEGAALEEPYANDPGNYGHLDWESAAMTQVCVEAVRRGWRIGTHAVGDRAVRTVLDVYDAVVGQTGPVLTLGGLSAPAGSPRWTSGWPLAPTWLPGPTPSVPSIR
jgi:predicted amidohydrolase YtcJ